MTQATPSKLRVLFLTTYFPKPRNPLIGPWALAQAQAFHRSGQVDLKVVSLNAWVPKFLGRSPNIQAYSHCPRRYVWGDLEVEYPLWLHYPIEPFKRWAFPNPLPQMRIGWLSARRALIRAVRQFRPDVIYAHHTAGNGYLAMRLNRLFDIPYIITDHDFGEINDCATMPKRRRFFQDVIDHAACMVGVSKRMTEDLKRIFPSARAQTVYNGVDLPPPEIFSMPRPSLLQQKEIVFSAAMFYERKGLPLLVQAFAQVAKSRQNAVLRIAGDGIDRPALEAAVAAAALGDRVQLLGRRPRAEVLQEMAWADVFALIGWDEPFASAFTEAMACGTPLLCANDGGINDVVSDGIHGRMIPPRDLQAAVSALNEMLCDEPARKRMGAAARRHVEAHLTWDANARAMIELFRAATMKT